MRAQAQAEADAAKVRGAADAEAARLRGLAEADVIRAKGEAEAEAMRVKAAAYHEYNQAAVLDKVITNLPEMVRAIAEPLSKVDKISIVSTGGANGGNLGASRVTGDVVNMLAQMPAILEALTGVKMSDLMAKVPSLWTVDGTASRSDVARGNGPDEQATQPQAQSDITTTTQPESNPKGGAEQNESCLPQLTAPPAPSRVTPNPVSGPPPTSRTTPLRVPAASPGAATSSLGKHRRTPLLPALEPASGKGHPP